jgi:hypothetical protein
MKPSKKAEAWRKEHSWFGEYQYATAIAIYLHDQIVASGIKADSDAYYATLEERLKPYAKTILAEQLGVLDEWLSQHPDAEEE